MFMSFVCICAKDKSVKHMAHSMQWSLLLSFYY